MSAAAVTLRLAEAADEPALKSLWCEAWQATYPAFDYEARWPGQWRRWHMLEAEIFVALREDATAETIVGMLVLAPQEDDALLLEQIALPPAEQGSGLAHLLLLFAKQKAGSVLRLTVNTFNERAIRFYEREAFQRCGSGINPGSGLPTFEYEWRR
ncbi:GNAT family N-acetyltransferase [Labrys sp. LIt4]|uniref:GNAT family N-acetyltransferase n=1 Tax=Labrys sp. LIt4 TaxID=2821355 RepID=UPI001AE0D59B|nr:GNAT family N-acetyltransferase [Labrys sp. LIt4]MBP0580760.1 GNAT family N-acetyltransferase [Labrys sp. LIt4]